MPESAKEGARPLAESSDIGLGSGDRAFEPPSHKSLCHPLFLWIFYSSFSSRGGGGGENKNKILKKFFVATDYLTYCLKCDKIIMRLIYHCTCSSFSNNLGKGRAWGAPHKGDLKKKAGLQRAYISALEGSVALHLTTSRKIANALGIDAYLLFIDTTKETSTDTK